MKKYISVRKGYWSAQKIAKDGFRKLKNTEIEF